MGAQFFKKMWKLIQLWISISEINLCSKKNITYPRLVSILTETHSMAMAPEHLPDIGLLPIPMWGALISPVKLPEQDRRNWTSGLCFPPVKLPEQDRGVEGRGAEREQTVSRNVMRKSWTAAVFPSDCLSRIGKNELARARGSNGRVCWRSNH